MSKKIAKVDPKAVAKEGVMGIVSQALAEAGYSLSDGAEYGMTKGTLIVHADVCDVQLKPITPKSGVDRYEVDEE